MPTLPKATVTHHTTLEKYAFPYFPGTVNRRHGWAWGNQAAPGRARPFRAGGAGEDDQITFTAEIEGERSRHERRIAGQSTPVDVSPDLHLMLSWVKPEDLDLTGAYGFPNRLFLKMGTLVNDLVVLDACEVTAEKWGVADGEAIVIAARVNLTFTVVGDHETAPQYRARNPMGPYTWRTTSV